MTYKEIAELFDKWGEGAHISCDIYGDHIKGARIHKEDGSWYICQNVKNGVCCKDILGYKYSWFVCDVGDVSIYENMEVSNMRLLDSVPRPLKVGDICKPIKGYCSLFSDVDGEYIRISELDYLGIKGYLKYDILDENMDRVDGFSGCFKESDLKLVEPMNEPERKETTKGKEIVCPNRSGTLTLTDMERMYDDLVTKGYISPEKPMKTITKLAKKLLDPDTRTLIEAGYLDSELELTEEGGQALDTIMFMQHKEELVKEAKKQIAESKKKGKKEEE